MRAITSALRITRVSCSKSMATRAINTRSSEWGVFPRETEGNVYGHNWSLVVDGVTPSGNAYVNARVPLLASKLHSKIADGKVTVSDIEYTGAFTLKEAGDSISHDDFKSTLQTVTDKLSDAPDLFVEDAGLAAHADVRVGTRIISTNPALAIIARNLLIACPPRAVNHKARFNGWKMEARWGEQDLVWTGSEYIHSEIPTDGGHGERPLVVFVGGEGKDAAVQFVENGGVIVGANIVVGSAAPVSAIVAALNTSAIVFSNDQYAHSLAVASTAVVNGKETILVIGGEEEVSQAAAKKNVLYGAYGNILNSDGVTPLWNGVIGEASSGPSQHQPHHVPSVIAAGKSVTVIDPNNMAFAPSRIIFYEKGASNSKLSVEDAVKKLVALTDDKKSDLAKELVTRAAANLTVVGSLNDVVANF